MTEALDLDQLISFARKQVLELEKPAPETEAGLISSNGSGAYSAATDFSAFSIRTAENLNSGILP